MDLWQMVVSDHANIEELCREVLRATDAGPNGRADLFADLQDELERHIAAQQNVLYPALASHHRTGTYVADLERKQDEILQQLDELAARPDKASHDWAVDFKELTGSIRHAFTLEENGALTAARGIFPPAELKHLQRAYERERIASYEARRWHMPQAMMPSRYGLPTGTVFGVLAGMAALGAGALLWSMSRPSDMDAWESQSRRPRTRFPREKGAMRRPASGVMSGQEAAQADEALLHGAGASPAPSPGPTGMGGTQARTDAESLKYDGR